MFAPVTFSSNAKQPERKNGGKSQRSEAKIRSRHGASEKMKA